jgi:hypothetical protein
MNYRMKYDFYTTICGSPNGTVSETGKEPHAVFTLSTGQSVLQLQGRLKITYWVGY